MTNLANISIRDRVRARLGEAHLVTLGVFRLGCYGLGLRKLYRSCLIYLIKRTGLFDRAFYVETNGDVVEEGIPPLKHYVEHGDREGRSPMALFDPAYYRTHACGKTTRLNALLHYAYVGRYRRISPSPWFDVGFYLAHNKDVARAGFDPLLHFVKWGGNEGRSPAPDFDSDFYLRTNPEVREARLNPLFHYLRYGRLEGRQPLPDLANNDRKGEGLSTIDTLVPREKLWESLQSRSARRNARLDVIVPVFKGKAETLRCLYSVLCAKTEIEFELVVIDDKSPESDLVDQLHKLASYGLFTLLSNSENRGFVYTVNRGIALHETRDVVLLNSDTEVYDGWIDRLFRAAHRHERNATVTPLSNNATICSYPRSLYDNPFPLELPYAALDALTAKVNADYEVSAPTGVGFCMYIKRATLREIGVFDENTFGKGYGEENDFCQRASKAGWKNVVAADVYVRHWGSTSFQGEKAKRVQAAMELLAKRYPNYHEDVAAFIRCDPLAEARKRLDIARLKRMSREKNVLIVCHSRGGGTERHVNEDIERLVRSGHGVFLLRPVAGKPSHAFITHPNARLLPNLDPIELANTHAVVLALREIGITEIHTHSFVDFSAQAPAYVKSIVTELGARWEANVHDYEIICPRINLADEDGRYCGEPDESGCNKCLEERGSSFDVTDIAQWRTVHLSTLAEADSIHVPDQDVANRLRRYSPSLTYIVSPHEEPDSFEFRHAIMQASHADERKLRIVVVGAISKLKGFDTVLGCARDAQRRKLPIEFVVMGYSLNDPLLEMAGVHVTGKYHDHGAVDVLRGLKPHMVWLPSLWPETYSYTLSIALRANVPIVAFDLGAIAARLRRLNRDEWILPLSLADRWGELNDSLVSEFVNRRKAIFG